MKKIYLFLISFLLLSCNKTTNNNKKMNDSAPFVPPVSYEKADSVAHEILSKMTIDEKVEMIGGHNMFYTYGIERLGIPSLLMSDATQGIRMLPHIEEKIGKSVAFPSPTSLAATWNPSLAYEYAKSIGEECRAAGISILLGPGVNIYRVSQNGRNFEYFGEDPFLGSKMIEQYIKGVQSTGVVATLKHFLCNNHEYHRRTTNVIVDERTLQEIYLPIFKAGIDAGAMAVMTSYNMVNGEYCAQSDFVIKYLLRDQLKFKWLVMSDWWSTYDPEKVIKSGLDLEMPGHTIETSPNIKALGKPYVRENAKKLLEEGKINEADIDRMVLNILRTAIAMNLYNQKPDKKYIEKFDEHEKVALNTAREGIVLLKNKNNILPISNKINSILVIGPNANIIPSGLGSAKVEGYNNITLVDALKNEFSDKIKYESFPSEEQIKNADIVILSLGTIDSEGFDRPFDLPIELENFILHTSELNNNVILIVNSGGGIKMTNWINKISGLIYAWYPGQIGNVAIAEVLSGKVNPSGKLPFTIEKDFNDSPGASYIPNGMTMENTWESDLNIKLPITKVEYKEGVLVGYRWYDTKNIKPLFPFGYGLSYTSFNYSKIQCPENMEKDDNQIEISFDIENIGEKDGAEIAQLYIQPISSKVIRPLKELKNFVKVFLTTGQKKTVKMYLNRKDFAYWDSNIKEWKTEPGEYIIQIGSSSNDIKLNKTITIQ